MVKNFTGKGRKPNLLEALWDLVDVIDAPQQKVHDFILENLLSLTQSRYAFWGYFSEDEGKMTLYAWSKEVLKDCKMRNKPIEYPVEGAGVWADAIRKRKVIIVNDYEKCLGKKGLPAGHAPIKRLLSVPIFIGEKMAALAVVANKPAEYTKEDAEHITLFVTTAQMIMERKKSEEKKNAYRMMVEGAEDYAIFMLDDKGTIISWNKGAERIKGYKAEEIIGKHVSIFYTDEDVKKGWPEKELETAAKKGKFEDEGWRVRKDGSRFWANIVIRPLMDEEGNLTGFVKIMRDLTKRKMAEERMKKTNRTLRILYRCNEALIFAKNEKELLDTICIIIVEEGGYPLSWIGYAEKGKKVKAAAVCGKHADYVKNIRVSWDESDFGKGPTGTAIKTGKPSIERDIEHGESYSPWREEAVKHGFKSSIALPLIANGKTIGALNIYSAEKDAFDTEEVNLLSQLADDLAYGIFALRNKAERERMEKELINERNLFIGGPVVVFKWKAGEENVPVEYVSPNVKDIFGYTPEELISGKIAYDDIIHPDDRERVISEAQSYRRKGAMQFEQEYRVITVNGEYRWVHDFTTIKKDEGGKITHYHGYLVDITERKKMEKALEKEREQLLSIFDGIDEPIYVVDPETYKILYVNNALKNTFGKDITGKRCYKVFQGLNKSCDFCTNDKIFGENFGKTYVWEFENRKTGKWYRCFDRGIVWPDGRKVRLELAMDITDRVKAEEKIQRAYREVERALKEEQKFKMATAHYFFNPIAIAKGYLDLALEEGDGEDKIKKAIEAITRVEKVVKNVTKSGEIRE